MTKRHGDTMTKRDLLQALKPFSDDAQVLVFWVCECGGNLEEVVDLNANGLTIQLNTESGHRRRQRRAVGIKLLGGILYTDDLGKKP